MKSRRSYAYSYVISLSFVISLIGNVFGESKLNYKVSWVGNSFSGSNNRWVQNFFIHMNNEAGRLVHNLEPLG